MRDPSNLTGFWTGRYRYTPGASSVTFLATLDDQGGVLTGEISEPNSIGSSSRELHAIVHGSRSGSAVRFVKTYDGASDAAHSVQYDGTVSADGRVISGAWRLGVESGRFDMEREILDEAEERAAVHETVPARSGEKVPASPGVGDA